MPGYGKALRKRNQDIYIVGKVEGRYDVEYSEYKYYKLACKQAYGNDDFRVFINTPAAYTLYRTMVKKATNDPPPMIMAKKINIGSQRRFFSLVKRYRRAEIPKLTFRLIFSKLINCFIVPSAPGKYSPMLRRVRRGGVHQGPLWQ